MMIEDSDDHDHNFVVIVVDDAVDQSCKMSQIWQVYQCKNIGKLG